MEIKYTSEQLMSLVIRDLVRKGIVNSKDPTPKVLYGYNHNDTQFEIYIKVDLK